MTVFLLDISRWQGTAPDLARAKTEGIAGVIAKATQGSGWVDPQFEFNLQRSRANGLLFAAYHYQESGSSAADQVANIRRVVPVDVPVIPDVEAGSGDFAKTREIVQHLKAAGYSVPLSYIPRWYWQQLGSPSLAGLPPLWSSRYPDNVQGYYRDEYAEVPSYFWDGYGGLDVTLLQFTSSGRVAGYGPLDVNAFRGTYAELTALLGGEVDDMFSDEDRRKLDEAKSDAAALWEFFKAEKKEGERVVQEAGYLRKRINEIDARLSNYPTLADIVSEVKAVKAEVEQVKAGNIDYARLARAVNDDAAKRLAA